MTVTASELRANVYRLLDQVIETGVAIEVRRRGGVVRIEPVETGSKLDRLVPHPDYIVGDPDDLIHMDWYEYWTHALP